MGPLLKELKETIFKLWAIGDNIIRIPLLGILMWPFILVAIAMLGWPPLTALIAMLPILPLAFLLIVSPIATGIAWNAVEEGKALIKALITIVAVELLIGLYLVFVPIENKRELVPVFILTTVTLALFLAAGLRERSAKPIINTLLAVLGIITLMFFIEPWRDRRAAEATEGLMTTRVEVGLSTDADTTFSITVGREWSDPVNVPLMRQINWERSGDLAAIEIRNQFGDTKSLPRGPAREHVSFPGRLSALQFRVTEEEADSVIIQIAISPIR